MSSGGCREWGKRPCQVGVAGNGVSGHVEWGLQEWGKRPCRVGVAGMG